MFEIIKKLFLVLLSSIINASNHTKCTSLSNQKCKIQPNFINLHPNEYSQEFHYYSFTVKLYRSVGSCSTLSDLSKVCIQNKTKFKRFESNCFQHDCRYKRTENMNKTYFM